MIVDISVICYGATLDWAKIWWSVKSTLSLENTRYSQLATHNLA